MTDRFDCLQRFHEEYGLTPVVAAEIEWYLRPQEGDAALAADDPSLSALLELVAEAAPRVGLALHSTDRERGAGQMEAALQPTRDPAALATDLVKLKALVAALAEGLDRRADFSAKPFAGDYGSALHIHLHLEDGEGRNIFRKQGNALSDPLRYVLTGLLEASARDLPVFAPTPESRARFVPGWHAPVSVSWGNNNRTTALRLPDGTGGLRGHASLAKNAPNDARRIEHRIGGADADPAAVIAAILEAALAGLHARANPPAPIHGDAGDAGYGLPPLLA